MRPAKLLVESKSLKLFLNSFRNHAAFHEDATLAIGKRIVAAIKPKYLRIAGYWYPRGGMPIDVFWQTGKLPAGVWLPDLEVEPYAGEDEHGMTARKCGEASANPLVADLLLGRSGSPILCAAARDVRFPVSSSAISSPASFIRSAGAATVRMPRRLMPGSCRRSGPTCKAGRPHSCVLAADRALPYLTGRSSVNRVAM